MKYYIMAENNRLNGCGSCRCLNPSVTNIEVTEEIYKNYSSDPLKYIYDDGQIVENPDYQTLKTKNEIQDKITDLIFQLEELDLKRIRAVCETEVKDEQTGQTWLDYYNSQIFELRAEIQTLNSQL